MKLCIVIPAYNEEVSIGETVREYQSVFPEAFIVVVDNNSSDRTAAKAGEALDPGKSLLISELRQGKGNAIKSGLSRIEADCYIMTDGDATYPADDARRLLDLLLATRADMIVGDRVSGGSYDKQNTRPGHGWGNKLLTSVISSLAGQSYSDVLSGLRIMSRPFVATLDVRSSGFQLETELNVVAAYLRAHVVESPIVYRQRPVDSHSKLNTIKDGTRILNFALTNWIAFAPMQPFLLLGSVMAVISGLLGFRVVAGFLETGWPYTTTATAAVASGLIAVLAVFHGITLRILGRNDRRREIASFLEAKRKWNSQLDREHL
jgi:glycosyltransferase involved in cell wall biosynthesis